MAFCPQNRTPLSYRRKQFPPCQSCQYLFIVVSWSRGLGDGSTMWLEAAPRPSHPLQPSGGLWSYLQVQHSQFAKPAAFLYFQKRGGRAFQPWLALGWPAQIWSCSPLHRQLEPDFQQDPCSDTSYGLRVLGSFFNLKIMYFYTLIHRKWYRNKLYKKYNSHSFYHTLSDHSPKSFQIFLHIFAFIFANRNIWNFVDVYFFMHKK